MMIFKCDICGAPFEYDKKTTNHISFYTHHISNDRYSDTRWKEHSLIKPYKETDIAAYDCCPKCVLAIENLLFKLRNKEEVEK